MTSARSARALGRTTAVLVFALVAAAVAAVLWFRSPGSADAPLDSDGDVAGVVANTETSQGASEAATERVSVAVPEALEKPPVRDTTQESGLDDVPPADLNEWPASKAYRKKLLMRELEAMRATAGTAQCFAHAQDVMVYSLGSILDSVGRSEQATSPHNFREGHHFFTLNQRAYRPPAGEFPELDEMMRILAARRDSFQPKRPAPGEPLRVPTPDAENTEVSVWLIEALEARAEEAIRILDG